LLPRKEDQRKEDQRKEDQRKEIQRRPPATSAPRAARNRQHHAAVQEVLVG
jgi:hypothetical protein